MTIIHRNLKFMGSVILLLVVGLLNSQFFNLILIGLIYRKGGFK